MRSRSDSLIEPFEKRYPKVERRARRYGEQDWSEDDSFPLEASGDATVLDLP